MPDRANAGATVHRDESSLFYFKPKKLTPREQSVLLRAAHGLSAAEIAGDLYLGERTVKLYLASVRNKLNAKNTVQAVAIAVARQLIPFDIHMAQGQ